MFKTACIGAASSVPTSIPRRAERSLTRPCRAQQPMYNSPMSKTCRWFAELFSGWAALPRLGSRANLDIHRAPPHQGGKRCRRRQRRRYRSALRHLPPARGNRKTHGAGALPRRRICPRQQGGDSAAASSCRSRPAATFPIAAQYRLSGAAKWPAQIEDAKTHVRWVRANAGSLGIDPSRIADRRLFGRRAHRALYRRPARPELAACVAFYPQTDVRNVAQALMPPGSDDAAIIDASPSPYQGRLPADR